jgi:mevalonate kinase
MVKVSAPGKVHLIGEHAVVYGEPAIIAAIGKRCWVEVEKSDKIYMIEKRFNRESVFEVNETLDWINKTDELWAKCKEKGNFTELFETLKDNNYKNADKAFAGKILKEFEVNEGIKITVNSDIPNGAGLGGSAAYAVALVKAASELFGKNLSDEEVNTIAYKLEQYNHGAPSGGDNSTCCFGGLIWFKKNMEGGPPIIQSLKEEIPYKLENFVLVYTKKPEKTTGELVQLVMNLDPTFRDQRIKALGEATYEMRNALKERDFNKMKGLMNLAQENLAELGVSIPEIDKIAEEVRNIGGAAKLSGAGGGGVMLCYHEDKEKLINLIKNLGYEPWETELAVEGVRIE